MAQRDEVFLTGASGFVGSHPLHVLASAGHPALALMQPASRPLHALHGCTPVRAVTWYSDHDYAL